MKEQKVYTVKKSLHHDGKRRRLGTTVQLTDEEAKPLIDLGVVVLGEPEDASSAAPAVALAPETLGKLNIAELTAYAQAHGVTVATDATKAQIIDALTPKA